MCDVTSDRVRVYLSLNGTLVPKYDMLIMLVYVYDAHVSIVVVCICPCVCMRVHVWPVRRRGCSVRNRPAPYTRDCILLLGRRRILFDCRFDERRDGQETLDDKLRPLDRWVGQTDGRKGVYKIGVPSRSTSNRFHVRSPLCVRKPYNVARIH